MVNQDDLDIPDAPGKVTPLREGPTWEQLENLLGTQRFVVLYYNADGKATWFTGTFKELKDFGHLASVLNSLVAQEYTDCLP
jgi:hypothetical protein